MQLSPLRSLIASGTRLWLDSVDPELVQENRRLGATGATSNPIIIAGLIRSGRFDDQLKELLESGQSDEQVAWEMTNRLVRDAQAVFREVWDATHGDDGYVSFELDPLLEDASCPLSIEERTARYVETGLAWAVAEPNRMIKVPATEAGLASLEELVARGVTVNVTLIFSERQYQIARDAVWRGAQLRSSLEQLKSVYSIFVSRVDVYTLKHAPDLSRQAQGQVGIVNAQRIFLKNREFWRDKGLPLRQEMIFASTGTKDPADPVDKYVAALAGADIQTNPPATNAAIQQLSGRAFSPRVDQLPAQNVLDEIDRLVNFEHLEKTLMDEGLQKFADPQKELIALIGEKREGMKAPL